MSELPTTTQVVKDIYDVIVVGGGPAGLASAFAAASQGLKTLSIEGAARPGHGDAGLLSEPWLGAPADASNLDFACRDRLQALGARLEANRDVVGLASSYPPHRLELDDGRIAAARAVVVATGARYRRLDLPNYADFENRGIHYAATGYEAALCIEEHVLIVGGGNSAGVAAVFLDGIASQVDIIIRGEKLQDGISSYTAARIFASPNIRLRPFTEVVGLNGPDGLEEVILKNSATGSKESCKIRNVFLMIGAIPNISWLNGQLNLDRRGFLRTSEGDVNSRYSFHTSRPGIFAVGDVRSGSIKRVIAAMHEGTSVIADISRYLASVDRTPK